jgi:hypothetical protein
MLRLSTHSNPGYRRRDPHPLNGRNPYLIPDIVFSSSQPCENPLIPLNPIDTGTLLAHYK